MARAFGREYDDPGKVAGFLGLRENAQTFREKLSLGLAVLLVAQRADALDGRIGKSGDDAGQGLFLAELRFDQLDQYAERLLCFLA